MVLRRDDVIWVGLALGFYVILAWPLVNVLAPRAALAQTTIDLDMSGRATSTGNTSSVAEDDTISWLISYQNISGNVAHDVAVSTLLNGNQTFVPGSAQTPPGWVFDEATQTFSAPVVCANNTATCGGASIQSVGLAVNLASTQGDGLAPVIHPTNGRIYVTHHHVPFDSSGSGIHQGPGIIHCVDTLTGSTCPGYPHTLLSGSTSDTFVETTGVSNQPEQIRFLGDRYFYPVYRLDSVGEPEWGLGCFDVNSAAPNQPGPCDGQDGRATVGVNGFVRMGPQNTGLTFTSANFYSVIEGPWEIEGRLYLADHYEMRLSCYDPATDQLCGFPYPVDLSHADFPAATQVSNRKMVLVGETLAPRLFILMNYNVVTNGTLNDVRARCWDTQTESFCWGNTIPSLTPGSIPHRMNAFIRLNTTGDPDAICSIAQEPLGVGLAGAGCTDLNGNAIASGTNDTRGVPNDLLARMDSAWYKGVITEELVEGRTYFPSERDTVPQIEGVICWDWTTGALCSGFGVNGLLTDGTPTVTGDYGVSYDERTGCLWSVGHWNQLWNFDANGNVPCQPSVVDLESTVAPATFFCGSGLGNVAWSWDRFQLYDVNLSNWISLEVDIIATDGATILQTYDLKSSGATSVDISGLPDINLEVSLSFRLRGQVQPGADIFAGGLKPQAMLHFASDTPGELCFQSQPHNGSCGGTATATTVAEARLQDGTLDDQESMTLTVLPSGVGVAPLQMVAPASASSFKTGVGTTLYHGHFDTGSWAGQLRAQSMNADGVLQGDLWDAAVKLDTQNWDTGRVICTYNPTTREGVPFRWADLDATQQGALNANAMGVPDANGEARLNYLRGDAANEGAAGLMFRTRAHRLGALVHSGPHYVGAPLYTDAIGNDYDDFRDDQDGRTAMVYVGSNDGMVHGFEAATGAERLAYVPNAVFKSLSAMTDPNWIYQPTVDGALNVLDAYGDFGSTRCGGVTTCWRSVLAGSFASGGQGIYALDATDPNDFEESDANQLLLWEFTDADDADLGDTWSQPSIVKMSDNRWAVVIGNGYNSTAPDGNASPTGHAVLYILFIEDGLDRDWTIGTEVIKLDTGVGSLADPNGLSTPAPVDLDGDMKADFIYAGDLHGHVWKFDVRNPDPLQWIGVAAQKVFTATAGNGSRQSITTRPEAGLHPYDPDGLLVYVGTGKYLVPGDALATSVTQSVYALWDEPNNGSLPIARTALLQQSMLGEVGNARVSTNATVDWTAKRGWYMDLPTTGERVVARPVLRNERLIFTTFIPTGGLCNANGTSWLMEVDAVTGSRLSEPPFDISGDGKVNAEDRVTYDTDSDGEDEEITPSGLRSTQGVLASPVILQVDRLREYKYNNSSAGGVMETPEDPGPSAHGRQSWRTLP